MTPEVASAYLSLFWSAGLGCLGLYFLYRLIRAFT